MFCRILTHWVEYAFTYIIRRKTNPKQVYKSKEWLVIVAYLQSKENAETR